VDGKVALGRIRVDTALAVAGLVLGIGTENLNGDVRVAIVSTSAVALILRTLYFMDNWTHIPDRIRVMMPLSLGLIFTTFAVTMEGHHWAALSSLTWGSYWHGLGIRT
jgi:hypothetical protein